MPGEYDNLLSNTIGLATKTIYFINLHTAKNSLIFIPQFIITQARFLLGNKLALKTFECQASKAAL